MSSIPLQLVTGFLGSGKTTFLKNYLQKFADAKRIGIIQNEYSAVNIDSRELQENNPDYQILEINNGSVFCVCLLGSFVDSLAAFIDQIQPDELIIEASGMSDPLSIGQILQSPKLRAKVYLDRVWTLVDAVNFSKITKLQTRVNHQIRIADTIIINKIDLADNKKDELIHLIKNINSFADILVTSFAKIDWVSKPAKIKFLNPAEKAENGRPDLQSQVVRSTKLISRENLDLFIRDIQGCCIRSKGYINLNSGNRIFMQITFGQFTVYPTESMAAPSEFVVIGDIPEGHSIQKVFEFYCAK